MALKKFCNKSGCNNQCDLGTKYCTEHTQVEAEAKAEYSKSYVDKIRFGRDAEYTEFYQSKEWQAMRNYIMAKYNGLDLYAYYVHHKIVKATMVHHIIECKEDMSLRLTESNLMPLSDASHGEVNRLYKHSKESTQKLLREILGNIGRGTSKTT